MFHIRISRRMRICLLILINLCMGMDRRSMRAVRYMEMLSRRMRTVRNMETICRRMREVRRMEEVCRRMQKVRYMKMVCLYMDTVMSCLQRVKCVRGTIMIRMAD